MAWNDWNIVDSAHKPQLKTNKDSAQKYKQTWASAQQNLQ